jgi:hypothetical protein
MAGPFWSFQGPLTAKNMLFQGPEKAPLWCFQGPEIPKDFLEFSGALQCHNLAV